MLPLMSAYSGGGEGCTLYIRGYNLMEFSALGCVPLLSVFFIPYILFGNLPKTVEAISLLLLCAVTAISYNHALIEARIWLETVADSLISHHIGMSLYPLCFISVLLIGKILRIFTKNTQTKGE